VGDGGASTGSAGRGSSDGRPREAFPPPTTRSSRLSRSRARRRPARNGAGQISRRTASPTAATHRGSMKTETIHSPVTRHWRSGPRRRSPHASEDNKAGSSTTKRTRSSRKLAGARGAGSTPRISDETERRQTCSYRASAARRPGAMRTSTGQVGPRAPSPATATRLLPSACLRDAVRVVTGVADKSVKLWTVGDGGARTRDLLRPLRDRAAVLTVKRRQ